MQKKKVLVICNSLMHAGGEKYTFELISNLNRDFFNIELLTTIHPDKTSKFHNYYYPLYRSKKVKIHSFLNEKTFEIKLSNIVIKRLLDSFLYRTHIVKILRWMYDKRKYIFFKRFDAILVVDILVYVKIQNWLTSTKSHCEIHLINNRIQFEYDAYKALKTNVSYNFVHINNKQISEVQESKVQVNYLYHNPLSLNFDKITKPKKNKIKSTVTHIGIFARLNRDKPLMIVFDAFYLLHKKNKNVKLFVYGERLDIRYYEELIAYRNKLNLDNFISFKGHTSDILKSVKTDEIKITWNLSIYDFVGYAALELIPSGCAIICNNICNDVGFPENNSNSIPPYFFDAISLSDYTQQVILNNSFDELVDKQFIHFETNHNIKVNMDKYQTHLLKQL